MTTLKELLVKYRDPKLDYSCSESTIRAANERFGLNMSEESMRLMAGFSGGMYVENTCGINTAAVAVLSHILNEGVAHQSPKLKEAVVEYFEEFKKVYSSTNCAVLKEEYRKEDVGCNNLIFESAKILEDIIIKFTK